MKPIAQNKKAYFNYEILEDWEAGLVLLGDEIKAIRGGRINITGSYIRPLKSGNGVELWWVGSNFNVEDGDQTRTKKILLSKEEIKRLIGKLAAGEYTIVPLELYLKRGKAKLRIGLAKHKKTSDKRRVIAKREDERRIRRRLNEKR